MSTAAAVMAMLAEDDLANTTLERNRFIGSILESMASASPVFEHLADVEYERRAREVFETVEATIDRFLQEDVIDIDSQRSGGLLELGFPNGSKIVLNTQPPLHELWLAAPSGGFHFRPTQGRWVDGRNGGELFEVLSACASEQGGRALLFTPRRGDG